MNSMKEKKYTHVQASRLAAAFLLEIYEEIKKTILKKGEKSKVTKLDNILDDQNLALGAIVSEIDYHFSLDWWQSLLRTKICLEAKNIPNTLLSEEDILTVIYDLIEFEWARIYDFSFILIIIKKTKKKDPLFADAYLLWRRLVHQFSENPENEIFTYIYCFEEVDFTLLPPHKNIGVLSLEDKKKIDVELDLQLWKILDSID